MYQTCALEAVYTRVSDEEQEGQIEQAIRMIRKKMQKRISKARTRGSMEGKGTAIGGQMAGKREVVE